LIGVAVRFSAVVTREGEFYVALCPELDVTSQGASVEDALSALREAIDLYLEDGDARLPDTGSAPLVTFIEIDGVRSTHGVGGTRSSKFDFSLSLQALN
jgi:predicted RNase H-like HicB family nuclease